MTTIDTRAGRVEGVRQGDLLVFKGIPYAAPPVGELRWLPPQPLQKWEDVRPAREVGAASYQNPVILDALSAFDVKEPQSEDCLVLNVWTPGSDGGRRPVLVWIHGGAFVIGSGAQAIYDGSVLASRGDVVVVTLNYRLGALGFLNLKEITGGRIPATGNEGLLDQVAALEWVRDNIANFGGDPDNVTIFGESAGGMSVGSLLSLPSAQGLFHKAIPQSGACQTAHTLDRAVRVTERTLAALDVEPDDVDALRAVSPQQLLKVQETLATIAASDPEIGGMPYQPVVDGDVQPVLPIERVRAGSAAGVAVLVGSILEEWRLFGSLDPEIAKLDDDGLLTRISANVERPQAQRLIETYRKSREARGLPVTPAELFLAIETDRVFRMPALQLAAAQREHDPRVYNYLFTWKSPALGGLLGACHALELGFVFGTIESANARDFSGSGPAVDALATSIQDAWIAFARSGDPSGGALGPWAPYGAARETMILGEESGMESAPNEEERAAWEAVGSTGRL
jgi:para-nitrobenzyl esterase